MITQCLGNPECYLLQFGKNTKIQGDIIGKVEHSEWASPTVPVIKPDGHVRICGHYSGTINQAATLEQYPVPTFEELLSNL